MTGSTRDPAFEPVIGLEIHVQLATITKMFCADSAEYGRPPNTSVCPVCLGLPGALPVPNRQAVHLGIRVALALHADIHERSEFARKNYFYPDMPKGYQITQYDRPLATGGYFDIPGSDDPNGAARIRIRRIHLEEDAGKSIHDRVPGNTAIDFNRAGVPLLEIVTEPDLSEPGQARLFLERLRRALEYLGVSDCNMEEGKLRVDANVSIREAGSEEPSAKTEIKNLNSFRHVEDALRFEIERRLGGGGPEGTAHETRVWDAAAGRTRPLRSKEDASDYRYFPEPDIPPLVVDADWIDQIREELPEMPWDRWSRFVEDLGLGEDHADVLTGRREVADYYEAVVAAGAHPRHAATWVMSEVLAALNTEGCDLDAFQVRPADLAVLLELVERDVLSRNGARDVFTKMVDTGRPATQIVADEGLVKIGDPRALEAWVEAVLAEHPGEVERYEAGEKKLIGFFMGQVMKRSEGKADPERVRPILLRELEGD